MIIPHKEVQSKLTKGLMDLIMLKLLNSEPMHGYQIITELRRKFGVYFGPSSIYPMLTELEKKGHVKGDWDMTAERPRKVYRLTADGQALLKFTENSLSLICSKLSNASPNSEVQLHAAFAQNKKSNLQTIRA